MRAAAPARQDMFLPAMARSGAGPSSRPARFLAEDSETSF